MNGATKAYLASSAAVAASTFALPSATGYGTNLSQIVVLSAWSLIALVTSGEFADNHHVIVWLLAGLINVFLFSIPAAVAYALLRNRNSVVCIAVLMVWLVFYLACLFVLFPATDGP